MKFTKIAKHLGQSVLEPLERLNSQVAKPMFEEAGRELGFESILGSPGKMGENPREIATEDLKRAREEQRLHRLSEADAQSSQEQFQRLFAVIGKEYRQMGNQSDRNQQELKAEVIELQEEIAQLAKTAGVETKAHLASNSKKVGLLDIKLLRWIIRFLKVKAEESKSAQELIVQRSNAKRTTGMLAWVRGKQMKVHEQGTMHLQG